MRLSFHWLLVAIPAAVVLDRAGAGAPLVFFVAAVAIVPLAVLIVHSTEHLAARTGPAIGGLLNATFGNLPELIILVVALRAGLLEMVRASLIGALLANLLLALGIAFLLGGLRYRVQEYNPAAARSYATMMLLATASMIVPSAFNRLLGGPLPSRRRRSTPASRSCCWPPTASIWCSCSGPTRRSSPGRTRPRRRAATTGARREPSEPWCWPRSARRG